MTEITGCLCFTADKKNIVFSDENVCGDYSDRYPWDSLSRDSLMFEFLEHFRASRRYAGKAVFMYRIKTTMEDLDFWFFCNVTTPFFKESSLVG
jgi:hypothetical protein